MIMTSESMIRKDDQPSLTATLLSHGEDSLAVMHLEAIVLNRHVQFNYGSRQARHLEYPYIAEGLTIVTSICSPAV